MSNKDKIRWGVLSTAKIGTNQVIPAMQQCNHAEIVAISSRKKETADECAARLGIPKSYGSYEEILEDPEIDAIYNPLPNHLHVPWTLKCLEHGKHVLCEKPLALTLDELEQVIRLKEQTGLKVGEAFMVKSHPQWLKVKELIQEGVIGKLELIHGFFSYFNDDPGNIRNVEEYGGGALWDIGCYPVTTSRFIFDEEPHRVFVSISNDPHFNIDRITSALMEFPSGKTLFTASTQLVPYQRMQFFGTEKMLEIRIPFNPPIDRPTEVVVHSGDKFEKSSEVISIPACNQFTLQGDAFSESIMKDLEEPVPLSDTYQNTKVIKALFRSAKENQAVNL